MVLAVEVDPVTVAVEGVGQVQVGLVEEGLEDEDDVVAKHVQALEILDGPQVEGIYVGVLVLSLFVVAV